jgi:5-methyltetrahydropteroyltriglutamate--homocysteine methyltransferase
MTTNRILTTHAGSLPRADALRQLVFARAEGKPYDPAALDRELQAGVATVVDQQIACGIDVVNDGEIGKTNFNTYVRERLAGFEVRERRDGDPPPLSISARDARRFGAYFAKTEGGFAWRGFNRPQVFCVEPLRYIGRAALDVDIANLKAAVAAKPIAGAYLNANTPGTIEHWMRNAHYPSQEALLYAIAEAMREEYVAIVEAGLILQIDDPDLPDAWQMYPEMTVADYRRYAELRVDALNHALRGLPTEQITLHVCWGSFHGPHQNDIPLEDIVDLIFRVRASRYSIEASNPMHEHEWRVFERARLPDGAVLIPGVVGHATDFIEHPQLVADRLERYGRVVGAERVMAGTDCGIGPRVGDPEICWAKLESLAAGARLATERLSSRAKSRDR